MFPEGINMPTEAVSGMGDIWCLTQTELLNMPALISALPIFSKQFLFYTLTRETADTSGVLTQHRSTVMLTETTAR